jgi:hypothetical protein
MAIGSSGDYRMSVDADYHFAADLIQCRLVRRTLHGYVPLTITIEEGEPMTVDALSTTEAPPAFTMPRELAELMMATFAGYLLGVPDGDLVRANQELRHQLSRVTNQLDNLIAGIGRMGGADANRNSH